MLKGCIIVNKTIKAVINRQVIDDAVPERIGRSSAVETNLLKF